MRTAVVLVFLAVVCAGCEEKLRPAVIPGVADNIPSQESWRSTVTFTDSGRVKAVVWSGHITMFADQRMTELADSVHVDFYDEFEVRTSTLTARRGRVNDVTQDFEAYENVVVESDSGTVLRTERLFWTNATQKIHTDAFVDITSPTERIMGNGMESDHGLRNYRIFRATGQALTTE